MLNIYSPLSKARKWNKIISWRYIFKKKIKHMYNLIKGLLPNIYKTTYIQYLHNLRLVLTHLFAAEFYRQRSQDIELQHRLSFLQWRAPLSVCSSFPSCPSAPCESLALQLFHHLQQRSDLRSRWSSACERSPGGSGWGC